MSNNPSKWKTCNKKKKREHNGISKPVGRSLKKRSNNQKCDKKGRRPPVKERERVGYRKTPYRRCKQGYDWDP
jgi:hypothetical protein